MSKITIGITTYNGAARVNELLTSISLRTSQDLLPQLDIVLVDDGSPDPKKVHKIYTDWHQRLPLCYIKHETNRGISAGWNTASRAFNNEYVILVNDDVIVSSGGWIEALIYPLQHSPGIGGVGVNWHAFLDEDVEQLLLSSTSDQNVIPRDPGSKQKTPDRRKYEDCPPGRVMCPGGQLFAFRRSDYDTLGGFDEYYKSFFEESDFGTAMAQFGKIGMQLNYPMCWHRWSATFSASPELFAHERMQVSRTHYINKWSVPQEFRGDRPGPFDYTNPKFLGAIGDIEVKYIKKDGTIGNGILGQNGSYKDI